MLQEQSELMSTVMNNTPTTVAALAAVAAASETKWKAGPRSSAQLEQLLYRYRAIQNHPKENKLEIKAIEDTFRNISRDQDIYETKLDTLRKSIDKGFQYDEDLLNKHLVALQLLEKDTDVPDYFLDLPDTKNDNTTAIEVDYSEKKPIKISSRFQCEGQKFGFRIKFSNAEDCIGRSRYRNKGISARISNRINELERLPANLVHTH
ncbi:BPK_HP2_G0024530.mRNA.1.CDS.1 [Saccharomyces cerevisiae]|nr:BPK_HP2_G0024530.mRNA.1.CDS.1 [Saccharomyces cerevisiae]CAI6452336.1 BPK_HP2_G0024530.mRNA.1.CDS.1 [Saccharomyces cerevisiae]